MVRNLEREDVERMDDVEIVEYEVEK